MRYSLIIKIVIIRKAICSKESVKERRNQDGNKYQRPDRGGGLRTKEALQALDRGYRVLAVGYSRREWTPDEAIPYDMQPLYLIILEDNIRKNVSETLRYFYREGVAVKVISADHVKTVSMVAKKAGLKHWEKAVDLSELGESVDYDRICEAYDVFARVTPKQKQELFEALKRKGHHVAMTGDGVNDLLALRTADCSIAVAEGSDASRQISQIVLLESDFTHLPQVVMEGRKFPVSVYSDPDYAHRRGDGGISVLLDDF